MTDQPRPIVELTLIRVTAIGIISSSRNKLLSFFREENLTVFLPIKGIV